MRPGLEKPVHTGQPNNYEDENKQEQKDKPDCRIEGLLTVEPQRRSLLPFRGIGGQHRDDVVDAARNTAAEIAGLEARRDGVGDDDFGQRVGERALESIADLDAHSPLVRRDQQQHAIVLGLLAELPAAEQLVGIGLDLLTFERGDGGNDKLDAGLGFEIGELARNRAARVGAE